MKPYLIILYLFSLVLINPVNAQNWKRGLAVAGYHLSTVAIGAVADGVYNNGNKELSHFLQATEIAMAVSGPFIFFGGYRSEPITFTDYLVYGLSYTFIRMAAFDPIINATMGEQLNKIGTTSGWDKALSAVDSEPSGYWFARNIFFTIGVAIPIKNF